MMKLDSHDGGCKFDFDNGCTTMSYPKTTYVL